MPQVSFCCSAYAVEICRLHSLSDVSSASIYMSLIVCLCICLSGFLVIVACLFMFASTPICACNIVIKYEEQDHLTEVNTKQWPGWWQLD